MSTAKAEHQKIPDGLVSEIGEYSALLRTLSIGTTSDLTGQLLWHEQALRVDEGSSSDETDDGDDESIYSSPSPRSSSMPPPTSPLLASSQFTGSPSRSSSYLPSAFSSPLPSRKRKLSASTPSSPRKRRTMMGRTRWPLLLEDVPKPEWELQDEVAAMMSHLRLDDPEEQEQDWIPAATLSTAHFLESLLTTIAGYTPRRADSLQNRLNPIDWRFVLRATTAQKFIDPEAVIRAERRLHAMYGGEGVPIPSTSTTDSSGRLSSQKDILDQILYLPDPPRPPEPEAEVVKRRNKSEGKPRRKYRWQDGRKLKRDLISAAKAKKKRLGQQGLAG